MNSRLVLGLVVLLVAGVVAAIIFQPPAWIVMPLGFAAIGRDLHRRKAEYGLRGARSYFSKP